MVIERIPVDPAEYEALVAVALAARDLTRADAGPRTTHDLATWRREALRLRVAEWQRVRGRALTGVA